MDRCGNDHYVVDGEGICACGKVCSRQKVIIPTKYKHEMSKARHMVSKHVTEEEASHDSYHSTSAFNQNDHEECKEHRIIAESRKINDTFLMIDGDDKESLHLSKYAASTSRVCQNEASMSQKANTSNAKYKYGSARSSSEFLNKSVFDTPFNNTDQNQRANMQLETSRTEYHPGTSDDARNVPHTDAVSFYNNTHHCFHKPEINDAAHGLGNISSTSHMPVSLLSDKPSCNGHIKSKNFGFTNHEQRFTKVNPPPLSATQHNPIQTDAAKLSCNQVDYKTLQHAGNNGRQDSSPDRHSLAEDGRKRLALAKRFGSLRTVSMQNCRPARCLGLAQPRKSPGDLKPPALYNHTIRDSGPNEVVSRLNHPQDPANNPDESAACSKEINWQLLKSAISQSGDNLPILAPTRSPAGSPMELEYDSDDYWLPSSPAFNERSSYLRSAERGGHTSDDNSFIPTMNAKRSRDQDDLDERHSKRLRKPAVWGNLAGSPIMPRNRFFPGNSVAGSRGLFDVCQAIPPPSPPHSTLRNALPSLLNLVKQQIRGLFSSGHN